MTVLGLATVRAIATTAAFDLFSEKGRSVPDDFWPHSVTTAAAAAAIARRVGIQPNDAFSAGLLHDLGTALVFRRAPRRYDAVLELLAGDPSARVVEVERMEFGMTHAEVGAAALGGDALPGRDGRGDRLAPHAARRRSRRCSAACSSRPTRSRSRSTSVEVRAERADRRGARSARHARASAGESLVDEVRSDQENLAGFLTVR